MPEEEPVQPDGAAGRHRGQQAGGPKGVLRQLRVVRHAADVAPPPRRHSGHAVADLTHGARHQSPEAVQRVLASRVATW